MRPNIVLVVADDLGPGDLSSSGNDMVHTPVLDSLRAQSADLSRHYSNSPVCAPARAALLTGRYPHRTGVIDTRERRGLSRMRLDEVTLAQRLKTLGYSTGLVGKWHLGAGRKEFLPTERGYDHFVGFPGGLSDYWDYHLYFGDEIYPGDGRYLTDVLTEHAMDYIRTHRSGPFFLQVAYNAPHEPLQAPADLLAAYADGPVSTKVQTIYAMTTAMDRGIGRIVDLLDELNIADDTLLVFTSDNGPDFAGGPQLTSIDPELVRPNCDLRGSKGVVYEGGLRVPCLVRWPNGGVVSGVRDELTQFVDWVPTLVEAAGASVDTTGSSALPLDGASFLDVLRGEEATASAGRSMFWQWNRYEPVSRCNMAIRQNDWKLVWPALESAMQAFSADSQADRALLRDGEYPLPLSYEPFVSRELAPVGEPMLFDVRADPGEEVDLASTHPAIVSSLTREAEEWFSRVEAERTEAVAAGLCQ